MEKMTQPHKATTDQWYYIIVQNPGKPEEQFLGFKDKETGAQFFPAFKTKEEAQQCFLMMPKDAIHNTYEIQAIIQEDLIHHAGEHEYRVFLMDASSRVKEEIH